MFVVHTQVLYAIDLLVFLSTTKIDGSVNKMETLAVDEAFLLNDNDTIRTRVFTLLWGS